VGKTFAATYAIKTIVKAFLAQTSENTVTFSSIRSTRWQLLRVLPLNWHVTCAFINFTAPTLSKNDFTSAKATLQRYNNTTIHGRR